MGAEGKLFIGDSGIIGFAFPDNVRQNLSLQAELFHQGIQQRILLPIGHPATLAAVDEGIVDAVENHVAFFVAVIRGGPEGIFSILVEICLPAHTAVIA